MNNLKNKNKNSIILCFNKIGEMSLNINNLEKNLGFWNLIDKFHLDSIGILNEKNNPKVFDSINSVFKFFNKTDEFRIKYIFDRNCDLCSYHMYFEEYYTSYISFNFADLLIFDSIDKKINSILTIEDSCCPKCCVQFLKNKNLNFKFKNCFKTISSNIILPKVLILSFDFEETMILI